MNHGKAITQDNKQNKTRKKQKITKKKNEIKTKQKTKYMDDINNKENGSTKYFFKQEKGHRAVEGVGEEYE